MVFASDLDSTLIYSERFCTLIDEERLLPVDFYNNNQCSFITKSMKDTLEHINESSLFIPVTTRTPKQYMRMKYFYDVIKPKYAVVANGGIILKNGIVLEDWSDIISTKIKEVVSVRDMIKLCSFFLDIDHVKSYTNCEDLFVYAIMDEDMLSNKILNGKVDIDYLEILRWFCSEYNYSVSKQGKKVYIVPNCINKYDPINYIMQLENITILLAAGDSLLDYPLIKHSNYGIVPCHGELLHSLPLKNLADTVYITKETGIFAGDEILKMIHAKSHELKDLSQDEFSSYSK